jgi:hypothetical protein
MDAHRLSDDPVGRFSLLGIGLYGVIGRILAPMATGKRPCPAPLPGSEQGPLSWIKDRISQYSFVEGIDYGVDFDPQIGGMEIAVLLITGSVSTWLLPSRDGLPALSEMPNGSADSDANGNADSNMIQSRA